MVTILLPMLRGKRTAGNVDAWDQLWHARTRNQIQSDHKTMNHSSVRHPEAELAPASLRSGSRSPLATDGSPREHRPSRLCRGAAGRFRQDSAARRRLGAVRQARGSQSMNEHLDNDPI